MRIEIINRLLFIILACGRKSVHSFSFFTFFVGQTFTTAGLAPGHNMLVNSSTIILYIIEVNGDMTIFVLWNDKILRNGQDSTCMLRLKLMCSKFQNILNYILTIV